MEHRRKELAIRIALGARPVAITAGLLGTIGATLAVAVLLGTVVVRGISRLVLPLLYETRVLTGTAVLVVVAVFGLAAFAAVIGPARRALRLDLRSELLS